MNNEQLSDCWYSISLALSRILRQVQKLPEREQYPEFSECLNRALDHSERRAEALIDPS
jgi:hypothetical protein